ncbi:MAG: response regulator transcription factor [Pseudorhodoplanes sp.]
MPNRAEPNRPERNVVIVIDDDASVRESLADLLGSLGIETLLFESVADFLEAQLPDASACLILDIRMPGMSGLELQSELSRHGRDLPIIFITGHGDVRTSVRAMKAGAIEFLTKPFHDQDLLEAIHAGLKKSEAHRRKKAADQEIQRRYKSLNAREREVMALVVSGHLNKQIAGKLAISEITVKVNRAQVMRKMQAASLPMLVRLADQLESAALRTDASAPGE